MSANILIIDDDPASCSCMKYLLTSYGHVVTTFGNGIEGLKSAFDNKPDLIISDSEIPGLTGCELARVLKQDATLREVPLLAVTASAMPADRQRMLSSGFDAYIAKPIVPETFIDQIEDLLPVEMRSGSKQPAAAPVTADRKSQMIRELSEAFVRNVPTLLASLWAAHEAKDFKSLRKAAHMTLGSCIFLKEPHLIEALRHLERSIDVNEPVDLESLLKEIDREVHSVSKRMGEAMPAAEVIS